MSGRAVKNGGFPHRNDQREGAQGSRHRVRFPDDLDENRISPLDVLLDLFTASVAAVCVAGLSTILVVLYVTVRPFSQIVYRRVAAHVGGASFIDALALLLPNTRIHLTGDSDIPSPVGTCLLVSNHLVDCDWWGVFMMGRCVGLRGSIKVFLRNEYLHINMQPGETPIASSSWSNSNGASLTSSGSVSKVTAALTASMNVSSVLGSGSHYHPQDLSLLAKLLHLFLEFPLIDEEDYVSNRNQLHQLLRSFADDTSAAAPVHLLFFPEGWSQHNGSDRGSILAKSNEFAHREGRPQLKHLLLPRSRGFNSSLECLRESNPVVYDVTMVRLCC